VKVYSFTQGNSSIDIHHDGSVDLFVPGSLAMRIDPTEIEDVSGLLTHAAVVSQRMHLDIGSMPSRCPFRKRDGLAFGARCLREPHGDTEHVF